MLQSLLGRNTLFGIVNEDPLQEVQEQPVEGGIGRDEFLQLLADIITTCERNIP